MSEIVVSFLGVSTGEFIGKDLSADSVDADCKVVIGNGSISGLNSPEGFRKSINGGRWIEDDLSSVETESHPMKRVMSSVTNIDANFAKVS